MEQRTFASQCARLVLAGIVTVIVMGASWWQIDASSHEMARPPIAATLERPGTK